MRQAPTKVLWRRTLRALREECPPLLPVRVRLVHEATDYFALTDLSRDLGHFNLTVHARIVDKETGERRCTRAEVFDSLVHEWAHCLAWGPSHSLEDHDALWGVAYAKCYNAVEAD